MPWATDVVFAEAATVKRLMPLWVPLGVRQGMLSCSSAEGLRYLGRKVNQSGAIAAYFAGTVETDWKRRQGLEAASGR